MTEEITNLKIEQMQGDITEIKEQLKELPNEIAGKINETLELKMEIKVQDLEKRFYKWVTGLSIGIISCLVGLIISFIKGLN